MSHMFIDFLLLNHVRLIRRYKSYNTRLWVTSTILFSEIIYRRLDKTSLASLPLSLHTLILSSFHLGYFCCAQKGERYGSIRGNIPLNQRSRIHMSGRRNRTRPGIPSRCNARLFVLPSFSPPSRPPTPPPVILYVRARRKTKT